MDYKLHYKTLIDRARNRSINGYTEQHHIVPRCVGGSDDSDNLVRLTAREHFVAHQLLIKIYNGNHRLVKAAAFMCSFSQAHNNNRSRNRLYGWIRERVAQAMSASQTGTGNSQYGSRWVSNPDTHESLLIKGDMPEGFYIGRNLAWKTCIVCNQRHLFKERKTCSNICALSLGRLPRKQVTGDNLLAKTTEKINKVIYKLTCIHCGNEFDHTNRYRKCCSSSCIHQVSSGAAREKTKRGVADDFGNIFDTLTEAADYYKITVEAIRYRIKIGRYSYTN